MRKAVEYIIVDGRNRDELEKNVNARIKEGFEPTGDILVGMAIIVGRRQWLQTMVKFEYSS
jgi:tyrosyl-tRNA synthetase